MIQVHTYFPCESHVPLCDRASRLPAKKILRKNQQQLPHTTNRIRESDILPLLPRSKPP